MRVGPVKKFKNLNESDFDRWVWRYLTFSKFISLVTYRALWFSKLNILVDQYEGAMPARTAAKMHAEHQKWKENFHPSLHSQFDQMNQRNVEDGRELTVVNCWFLGDHEEARMWEDYAKDDEGVAIVSTVRMLAQSVHCIEDFTQIGKVRYVDLADHTMSHHEASQAQERAFLKSLAFQHEQEIRIATMSVKGPMCVGNDGVPLSPEQYAGAKMNNFDNPGLFLKCDLKRLITSIVLAPGAPKSQEFLVKRIIHLSSLTCPIERSKLGDS
jgi:hypothetical protein